MFLMNRFDVGTSIMIGMNLCPAPQISEHCPTIMLGRFIIINVWLIRPGMASTFNPNAGRAHE